MEHAAAPTPSLTLEPIGYARTPLADKACAARQPRAGGAAAGRVELLPGRGFEHALVDLAQWRHIWLVFWFDRNVGWRPKVLPPRSRVRRGVFATRSPHRPNPLGLSAVELTRVDGLTLFVRDIDLLDGTPIFDIKPYVPYTDAIAESSSGWLASASDPVSPFAVQWEALAAEQAAWIEARTGLPLRAQASATLALGPEPHPYRRIRRRGDELVLAVKEWRLHCSVQGRSVRAHDIASGYRRAQLAAGRVADETLGVHREFLERWPRSV